jgi:hypothetical protein
VIEGGNGFGVQVERDALRRPPGRVVAKDPPHHRRLGGVDLAHAGNRLAVGAELAHHPVAKGVAAATVARRDTPAQAAARLLGKVLQVKGIHRALQPDMQLADLPLRQRDEPDAGEAQPLEQRRHVLLITRQTVQRLRHNHLEGSLARPLQQRLIARPQGAGAADRRIAEHLHQRPALPRNKGAAVANLVVERLRRRDAATSLNQRRQP